MIGFAFIALVLLAVASSTLGLIGSGSVSFGTTVALGASASPSAVVGPTSISWSGLDANQVRVGALDDSTRFFTFLNGRITGGTVDIEFEYRASNYTTISALLGTDNLYYTITFPDARTVTGRCNIASLSPPSAPEDDRITFTVRLQINSYTWSG